MEFAVQKIVFIHGLLECFCNLDYFGIARTSIMQHTDRSMTGGGNMQSSQLLPYGLKLPTPTPALAHLQASGLATVGSTTNGMSPSPLELQRAQQLYDYNARLQYSSAMRAYNGPHGIPYHLHPHEALAHAFFAKQLDPRARFLHEEPKPAQSYIGLISMAILQHKDHKLVLADIYQWIMDNFAYFRNRGPGWRNSIRHNLSLNDCFIKSGRSANGKGHYWAIHPANKEDFKRGDFRRRRAQRKVRKAMGLAVPDDEDDSPSPPPASVSIPDWSSKVLNGSPSHTDGDLHASQHTPPHQSHNDATSHPCLPRASEVPLTTTRKRLFDVESLLAPDSTSKCDEDSSAEKEALVSSEYHNGTSHSDEEEDALLDVCDTDDESADIPRHRPGVIVIEPTCPDEDKRRDNDRSHHGDERINDSFQEDPQNVRCPLPTSSTRLSSPERETSRPATPISATSTPSSTLSSPTTETRGAPGSSPMLTVPAWPQHAAFINGNKLGFSPAANPAMAAAMLAASNNPATAQQHGLWPVIPSSVYPMLGAPFQLPGNMSSQQLSPAEQAQAAQRWHEAVSRMMARPYEKNVKLEA